MSKHRFPFYIENFSLAIVLTSILTLSGPTAAIGSPSHACTEANFMPLNARQHGYGDSNGRAQFFRLEVPTTGLLTVDVTVSGAADAEAKLGFFGRACEPPPIKSADFTTVSKTPTGLMALTDTAGTYIVGIAPQDPRRPLDQYKLVTGFVSMEEIHFAAMTTDSTPDRSENHGKPFRFNPATVENDPNQAEENEDEKEIEPNFRFNPMTVENDPNRAEENEDEKEIEPNFRFNPMTVENDPNQAEENEDEKEIEPNFRFNPMTAENDPNQVEENEDEKEIEPNLTQNPSRNAWSPDQILHAALRQVCRKLETDDHQDIPICASQLRSGRRMTGHLLNSWEHDQDLFVFRLSQPRTIEIASSGSTDTLGTLFDRHGHRLATDDNSEDLSNFRIVKALNPGLYYLRIEGTYGAEGAYNLRFETHSW